MSARFYSLFLAPTPSFRRGLARIFDFGLALDVYNVSETPGEADATAIRADWLAIGQDMREAVAEARQRLEQEASA